MPACWSSRPSPATCCPRCDGGLPDIGPKYCTRNLGSLSIGPKYCTLNRPKDRDCASPGAPPQSPPSPFLPISLLTTGGRGSPASSPPTGPRHGRSWTPGSRGPWRIPAWGACGLPRSAGGMLQAVAARRTALVAAWDWEPGRQAVTWHLTLERARGVAAWALPHRTRPSAIGRGGVDA